MIVNVEELDRGRWQRVKEIVNSLDTDREYTPYQLMQINAAIQVMGEAAEDILHASQTSEIG